MPHVFEGYETAAALQLGVFASIPAYKMPHVFEGYETAAALGVFASIPS